MWYQTFANSKQNFVMPMPLWKLRDGSKTPSLGAVRKADEFMYQFMLENKGYLKFSAISNYKTVWMIWFIIFFPIFLFFPLLHQYCNCVTLWLKFLPIVFFDSAKRFKSHVLIYICLFYWCYNISCTNIPKDIVLLFKR